MKTILKNKISLIVFFILIVLLATLPIYVPSYTIILLTSIIMFIILTVSWTFFSGPSGYISLATAAFFGVGIYTAAVLGKQFPIGLVVLIAGVLSFVIALIIGVVTLRLRGIYFTIFTFGLVELIKQVLLWYEVNITGTRGRFVVLIDNTTIYYIMLIIFFVLMVVTFIFKNSRYGMALQSIGENEDAAVHIGINTTNLKIITFALSALFIGAAGCIIATRWTYIDPYIAFNPLFSFTPVLMAIFGGIGQIYGPIIGAAIFAYLEEILLTKFPYYYMLLFGIVLVVVILYLPDGLVGLINRWRTKGVRNRDAIA